MASCRVFNPRLASCRAIPQRLASCRAIPPWAGGLLVAKLSRGQRVSEPDDLYGSHLGHYRHSRIYTGFESGVVDDRQR